MTAEPTWATPVADAMARAGHRVAFRTPDATRTHAESLARASRLAHALAGQGIGPGDRVALVVDAEADAVESYLAVGLTGATAVQVNDRLQGPEIAEVLDLAAPRAVIHTAAHAERLAPLLAGSGVLVVGHGAAGRLDLDASAAMASSGTARPPRVLVPAGTPGIVGFTSGTTGRPKGVVHTHANLARIVRHMPAHDGLRWGSRCGFTGTLAFAAGIWGVVLPHLYVGGEISWMAGLAPDAWVDRMIAERTTFTYAPTPLMGAFADAVRRRPEVLDHLDGVLHSGSLAPREATVDLVDAIGHRYVETYGMTETGAPVTATVPADWRPGAEADDPFSSAGRATSIARVLVLDEHGAELPAGEVGEVVVESETLFAGYLDDPVQTAEALRDAGSGRPRLHTGDLGSLDAAGHLYVRGRAKDMIVTGGMNVYPAEVERVIARAEGVADVAVLGVPDERWGETVVAAVVPTPGASLDLTALEAFVRGQLAGYKKPTRVRVVDELPRNASLKVRKDVLRREFEETP
ncbi:MAG: AMP-binding protein [Aeromicrobium sp.]|uniref:class I adenylate-forming enzyme family protein n=1 Tax=Aeromicrobium sp. TaxID=1871063 RepID=UPI0025BCEA97|nr:AMP-binding protein [Aeromicrobium sp.]MCK5892357.1 AMP-binding protein [Aeromicrobium sp.]MDF1706031.1 AMP-binding protein [Aeromicrobium sp.]